MRIKGNSAEEELAEGGVGWSGSLGETASGNQCQDGVPLATGMSGEGGHLNGEGAGTLGLF